MQTLSAKNFRKFRDVCPGYNLPELLPEKGFNVARALVGSESTCVTIVEATLKLIEPPKTKSLVVLGYPDSLPEAGHAVPEILKYKPDRAGRHRSFAD